MIVVFDFDKTLTNKDTLFGFYSKANKRNFLFFSKRVILIFFAILFKMKLISNDRLKWVGIYLFLKGKTRTEMQNTGKKYAQTIQLNKVYEDVFLKTPRENRIIVSASLEEYLKPLFGGERIFASNLLYRDEKVIGLNRNMYRDRKKEQLKRVGTEKIDVLYTDSFADKPLMEISDKVFLVSGERIFQQ